MRKFSSKFTIKFFVGLVFGICTIHNHMQPRWSPYMDYKQSINIDNL